MKLGKKCLSLLLALVMVMGMVPLPAAAATCTHHKHSAACGYAAPVAPSPCKHLCGDACAQGCTHVHSASCGYSAGTPGAKCTFNPATCQECAKAKKEQPKKETSTGKQEPAKEEPVKQEPETTTQEPTKQEPGTTTQEPAKQEPGTTTQETTKQEPDTTTQEPPKQEPETTTQEPTKQEPETTTQEPTKQEPDTTTQEPAKEESETTQDAPQEDAPQPPVCSCETRCTVDSVKKDCPVCAVEEAKLEECCKGSVQVTTAAENVVAEPMNGTFSNLQRNNLAQTIRVGEAVNGSITFDYTTENFFQTYISLLPKGLSATVTQGQKTDGVIPVTITISGIPTTCTNSYNTVAFRCNEPVRDSDGKIWYRPYYSSFFLSVQRKITFVDGTTTLKQTWGHRDTNITAPMTQKDGYQLAGWEVTDPAPTGSSSWTYPDNLPDGNVTLTAKWAKIYTVNFTVPEGEAAVPSITTLSGNTISDPGLTKTGYTATWYTDSACTTPWNFDTDTVQDDMTLYAKWTPNTYNVTLNLAGGSGDSSMTYTYGVGANLPTPTRTGYNFAGWFDSNDTSVTSITATDTGDKALTAKWTVCTYTITFKDEKDTSYSVTETKEFGATLTKPTRTAPVGHELDGWYVGNTKWDFDTSTVPDSDITLTAKWTPLTYTVNLTTNDGTILDNNVTSYTYGTAVTLPTNYDIAKEGYTFLGWYDNEELEGIAVTQISAGTMVEKTFYAKWTPTQYELTLELNGGTLGGTMVQTTYTIEDAVNLPSTGVTREGYTFDGWYENPGVTGTAVTQIPTGTTGDKTFYAKWNAIPYLITYKNGEETVKTETADYDSKLTAPDSTSLTAPNLTPSEAYHLEGWYVGNKKWDFDKDTVAGDTTLTAKWAPNTYTVTLNKDGGTIATGKDVTSYTYGTGAALPTEVTKSGYAFKGWYDNVDLTGKPVTSITKTDTGDKTFYAKWAPLYTITFDTKGGSTVASITKEAGETVTAPKDPTRKGYRFDGWDKEIPKTMPAENMTITAKWVETRTVTFKGYKSEEVWIVDKGTPINNKTLPLPKVPPKSGYTGVWKLKGKAVPKDLAVNDDITIEAKYTKNSRTWNPKTGDTIMVVVGVMAVSFLALCGIGGYAYWKKRKK